MFVRRAARHGRGRGLIEERHREVAEIEKLGFNPLSLIKLLKNPLRRFFRKPALTRVLPTMTEIFIMFVRSLTMVSIDSVMM